MDSDPQLFICNDFMYGSGDCFLRTVTFPIMPYPKYSRDDEDPEEVAERELEEKNAELGLPKDARHLIAAAKKQLPVAPQPSPMRPVPKAQKEAKAMRKKRARGVSGSSIKKDGGRFDMGLDDYDLNGDFEELPDDVDVAYDEFQRHPCSGSYSSRSAGFGSMESDSEASNDSSNAKSKSDSVLRLKDVLLAVISPEDDGFSELAFPDLLAEEYDEVGRIKLVHEAVSAICKEKDLIVADPEFEHRLTVAIMKLIQQGLIKSATVDEYLESMLDNKDHGWLIISAAVTESQRNRGSAPDPKRCLEKLAKELVTEYDTKEVAMDFTACNAPFYHANFVCQVCTEAISSMNMNVIYFVCTAFKDLLDHNALESWSINVGFERFFKSVGTLEMDLPCATSLATMLMSYAANDLQIISAATAAACPKPLRFIRAGPQGKLSVVEDDQKDCNGINYFIMDN